MKTPKFLFVLAAAALLTACGGNSSATEDVSSAEEATSAVSSSAGDNSHEGPGGSGEGPGGGGETSSSTSETDSAEASTGSATDVTDTSGNAISSGSATLTFSGTSATFSAAYLIDGVDVEISSGTYASASGSSDQVVFLVINGGSLKITGTSSSPVSITKSGSAASNGQVGDAYSFYGINSAIVVAGSASSATISYANISTTSNGSNAVVSTLSANVTVNNSTITTSASAGSRGLHATYDGSISADNDDITTQGASCATLATDRGGGTVVASNMTLETNGAGSPLVYSTDSITVSNSEGTANVGQMVVVEGGSSATLTDCNFSAVGGGNRSGTSDTNSSTHTIDACGIMIYQSQSGDSSDGTDYFTATNCSLKVTSSVPMIWATNITAVVTLSGNTFTQYSSSDYFLVAEATDQWGSSGSNGADVTVKATNQDLTSYTAYEGTGGSSISVSGSSFKSIA